ncbi:hypothetical protein PRIPAC_96077 [Pristionchus pacificus]|nr:hypothetical protein PRIPAC_96077 [Pristionchus pacificus]
MGANQSDLIVPREEGVSAGPPGSMLLTIFDDRPAPPLPQELRQFQSIMGPNGINREELAAFVNRNRRPAANVDHREEVFENDFVIPPVIANSTPEQSAYEARVLLRNAPAVDELAAVRQEFEMRQALAKRQLKSKIILEQLWITESFIASELPLDEVMTVHEIFVKTHKNPHRLLKRAIMMVQLNNVRMLMRTARRFRSRIEQLHEQMDVDAEQPIDMGGWREIGDEDGPQCFINEEGLIRMDAPAHFYAEEDERERRIQQIQTEIKNVEEFVIARVNKLLEDIHKEKTMCRTLVRKIGKAIEKNRVRTDICKHFF